MTQESTDRSPWFAILWLLPTGLLALPGLLAFDPLPHASGTGWALLFALPAMLALPFGLRFGLPKSALLFAPLLAILAISLFSDSATDQFELGRTAILLPLAIAGYLAGASFSNRAKFWLQAGAMAISLAFTSQALISHFTGGEVGLAGPLGNSGVLSQVALPGAVMGALAMRGTPLFVRALGVVAALSFVVHAGLTPVLTGTVAFALALTAVAIFSRREKSSARFARLAFAALAPLLIFGAAFFANAPSSALVEPESSNVGGLEARLLIWKALPSLILDQPLLGVGPGQFRAQFPPYRDPVEIEFSTYGHAAEAGVEVEHAHSDFFQVAAEYGLIGGLAFAALLVLLGLRAFKNLADPTSESGSSTALSASALAMLVYAALHTPLSFEPAPALLTWVLFGAMMSSDRMIGERYILGRLVGINLAVFMLGSVPFALSLTKHGELLAERQLAARDHEHRLAQDDRNIGAVDADFWLSEGRSLRLAVEAAPESALVHSLSAVHFAAWEATEQIQEQARSAWARVLEIRPHQVSALIGLGLLVPTTSERRELWEHALDLDPTHPITLQNLARLETLEGDIERALEYIATLDDTGRTDASMLRDLGGRALLAGRTANGAALLSKVNPEFDLSRPDDLFALSQQAEQLGHNQLYSDALAAGAHRLWGIENLLAGDYAFGIAKFRQALRRTRRYLPEGDTPTRLALIAALELAERSDDAHAELENLESLAIEPAIWAELPEVARGALQRLGIQSAAAESEKESEDSE